jgi:hypothetical protein
MNYRHGDWNHLLADVCFLQGFREQLQITYNPFLKVNIMITKEDLKQEIERLDSGYLELVFNLLKQFPHQSKPDPLSCSRPIEYTGTKVDKIAQLQASQQDSLFLNDLHATNDDFAHVDSENW